MTVAASPSMTPAQQDRAATSLILSPTSTTVDRIQQVTSQTVFPAQNPTLNVPCLNVGLAKRFFIEVVATIANTGPHDVTLTEAGLSNLFALGGIQYTDLNNFLRINTSGAHLTHVANAKRRHPMGITFAGNNMTANNRSQVLNVNPAVWPVYVAPTTITAGNSGAVRAVFEVPLAYSDTDLRGAVWANVLNAVHSLTLTLNTQAVTADPNDATYAVYEGAAGSIGSISQATITIYQQYLDNLPVINGKVLRPELSLATVYELKSTTFKGIAQNAEFQLPYANQRAFISTILQYNSDGTATGRNYGTDLSYLALQVANASYIWKADPLLVTQFSREELKQDLPAGTYYLPSRKKNITTAQFGNMQLTINPNSAGANAYAVMMVEDFALLQALVGGPSLAS